MTSFISYKHLPPMQLTVPLQATGRQVLSPEADAGGFSGAPQEQKKHASVWMQFFSFLLA